MTRVLNPEKYELSGSKHEKAPKQIKADDFADADAETSKRPFAVIFGGQPGSGKSAALSRAMFEGDTFEIEDDRKDYGEIRITCFGRLAGRLVVIGYTPRGTDRHIFSMRNANEREQERIGPRLGL